MKGKIESRFTPKKKPKDLKKTLTRLFKYFKGEKGIILSIFLLVLLDSFIVIIIPLLIGKSIDLIDLNNTKKSIMILALVTLLLCYIIDSIVNLFKEFLIVDMSQRVVRNLRNSVFEKLQNLSISYFDSKEKGDLMSRISNDVDNISSGISSSIVQIITSTITILGTLIMMYILSPILTIISIITMPLIIILSKTIAKRSKKYFKSQQLELGRLNSYIEEDVRNINIVKSFNYEESAILKFDEINNNLFKVALKAQVYSSLLMPMMNVITNVAFTTISIVGSYLSIKNLITIGTIATFLSYTKQFTRPLNELANLFNTFQISIVGCERIFEILDEKKHIMKDIGTINASGIKGNIQFKNVYFKYENGKNVLNNVNLTIEHGTNNAIIGTTGSGKTTIINLINRLYEDYEGSILLDNIEIKEYGKQSFLDAFSVVSQDIYLFKGTILENIRYSKLNASKEEIIEACKIANAHEFIKNLKNKYDTYINEGGDNLSIGQKQLISIARAILKNPDILILDEATSSIDTNTERKVQDAIKNIMKNRTSIIIAHRLSTIKYCDNIIVVDKGKIIESGSHKELMQNKGIYYDSILATIGKT
ncbi:ATP-binding cassette domain-containing protein [Paeniclostridium sordellii]|uniref:ABC transporter ATP-binding protein n=1 Tax=Paraclostridium sordellii TaxID=1505 RepID=UPI0012EE099B|nr:ABC transporter ATP-binding protein [Paeniclostridium sordellii]MVO72900.1 ATP-binding cassette domain-containing protein [Paeniclostridium sordellii]